MGGGRRRRATSSAASGRIVPALPARPDGVPPRVVVYCSEGARQLRGIEMGSDTSGRMGTMWTAERLRDCVEECCGGQPLVVLANREPLRHECGRDGEPVAFRSASGLVTALEPLLAACRGVWIAHGAGAADRVTVTARDGLNVPSSGSAYR